MTCPLPVIFLLFAVRAKTCSQKHRVLLRKPVCDCRSNLTTASFSLLKMTVNCTFQAVDHVDLSPFLWKWNTVVLRLQSAGTFSDPHTLMLSVNCFVLPAAFDISDCSRSFLAVSCSVNDGNRFLFTSSTVGIR